VGNLRLKLVSASGYELAQSVLRLRVMSVSDADFAATIKDLNDGLE
jgi:hypothetical protein